MNDTQITNSYLWLTKQTILFKILCIQLLLSWTCDFYLTSIDRAIAHSRSSNLVIMLAFCGDLVKLINWLIDWLIDWLVFNVNTERSICANLWEWGGFWLIGAQQHINTERSICANCEEGNGSSSWEWPTRTGSMVSLWYSNHKLVTLKIRSDEYNNSWLPTIIMYFGEHISADQKQRRTYATNW